MGEKAIVSAAKIGNAGKNRKIEKEEYFRKICRYCMYRRENARCAFFCLYIQAGAVRISVRAAFFFAGIFVYRLSENRRKRILPKPLAERETVW